MKLINLIMRSLNKLMKKILLIEGNKTINIKNNKKKH